MQNMAPQKAYVHLRHTALTRRIDPRTRFETRGDIPTGRCMVPGPMGYPMQYPRGWGNLQAITGESVGRHTLTHSLSIVSKNPFGQAWLGKNHCVGHKWGLRESYGHTNTKVLRGISSWTQWMCSWTSTFFPNLREWSFVLNRRLLLHPSSLATLRYNPLIQPSDATL